MGHALCICMLYNEMPLHARAHARTRTHTHNLAEPMSANLIKARRREKLWIGVNCTRSCKFLLEPTFTVVQNSPLCWTGRFCNWFCAISVCRWSRITAKLFFSCYLNVIAQNNIYPSADVRLDTQKDEQKLPSVQFRRFLGENSF
jgi:hypothetical protein